MRNGLKLLMAALLLTSIGIVIASQTDHFSTTPSLQLGKASSLPAAGDLTLKENVFVGSIKSDKYHYPGCSAAQRIKPENEIWFSSSADARAHGYVPCGICNPP